MLDTSVAISHRRDECDEGVADECEVSDRGAGASRTGSSTSRCGDGGAVLLGAPVLPCRRQGAGEVRDAAGGRGRWGNGGGRRRRSWLLPGRVLPGAGRLRRA